MAGRDLNFLANQMNRIADRVESNTDKLIREVTRNMGASLGYSTPVDTSRARANWQFAIDSAPTSYLYAEPAAPPSPASGSQMAINSSYQAALAYKHGSTVYAVNNAPYITKLNAGSSSQAPAGFVYLAVIVAIRTIRNTRLLR